MTGSTTRLSGRPHGYARYRLDGCRCNACGFARSEYDAARTHAIQAGTWQPFVDAEPARQHVLALKECGLGERSIANLAGLNRKAIRSLLVGRPDRGTPPPAAIRPTTAAAILGVEPTIEHLPGRLHISSVGTRRRIQALVAAGWPQTHLASRAGWLPTNFCKLVTADHVTVHTARVVRRLYDELWNTTPESANVPAIGITRARRHAEAQRWAPVGAWDDDTIDDPEAHPDWTGQCGTPQGYFAHRAAGLPTCDRCRAAQAERNRENRHARQQS